MSRVTLDDVDGLIQGNCPFQGIQDLLVSQPLHGYHLPRAAHLFQFFHFRQQPVLHHEVHPQVDPLIQAAAVHVEHIVGKIVGRFLFALRLVVGGNLCPGLFIKLQGADHTLYIILMDRLR